MELEHIRPEIERMRQQISRQRKDIQSLHRAGISTLPAEALLARMQASNSGACNRARNLLLDVCHRLLHSSRNTKRLALFGICAVPALMICLVMLAHHPISN
jgi:hypothetical protein